MKTRKSMTLAQGINSVLILLTLAVGSGAVSVNTAWCQLTTEEWVARYNAPYSGIDNAKDIAVDAAGNVYVTGSSSFRSSMGLGDSPIDYVTVKYDAAGNQLWVARYNGPGNGGDVPSALAVDAAGNVYVTGGAAPGAMRQSSTMPAATSCGWRATMGRAMGVMFLRTSQWMLPETSM